MNVILTQVEGWVTAATLAATMFISWVIGWWRGRQLKIAGNSQASKFHEACLALLGLLLAFTFSMALTKHDQRRQMVVTDSNAIGDFYTCASLLKEPIRAKLQGAIRQYVENRLALGLDEMDEVTLQKNLAECQEIQNQMQNLVGAAVDGGTPVTVPLVNTLNEVTSSHAARLAALRDRLAPAIVMLLFLAAVLTMGLIGRQQGASGEWEMAAAIGFVLLISMVVGVTLDLNQPHRGLITVSQEPMQRLLSEMSK